MSKFFETHSPFFDHPLLTAEKTAEEIDFIVSRLDLQPGMRILDVGCGFGRHSVGLAQRGFDVVGIDPSAAMIAAARERAHAANVAARFQQVAAQDFQTQQKFDVAICLFTTLGQISESGDTNGLLEMVQDALKADGRLVVEVPQRATAVANLKPFDKFGTGERYTAVSREFDPASNITTERFELVAPESTRKFLLRYRLYSQEELQKLLIQAGFQIQARYENYAGTLLHADSARMLFIAGIRS